MNNPNDGVASPDPRRVAPSFNDGASGDDGADVGEHAQRGGLGERDDNPDGGDSGVGATAMETAGLAAEIFGSRHEAIKRYVDILASRGIDWGLLGPRESGRLWDRHVLNSVALSGLIPEGATVADVGSGAGLPGIPLAIARPDVEVVLIESLLRRATFLELAVDELGLAPRVRVIRDRAENCRFSVDVVTCRAVAPLTKLLTWTTPLFMQSGRMVALKGATASDEVAAASAWLRRHQLRAEVVSVRAHQRADATSAVVVQSR